MSKNINLQELLLSKSNYELIEIYKMGFKHDIETIEIVNQIIESRGGVDAVYEIAQVEIEKMPLKEELHNLILSSFKNGESLLEIENKISTKGLTKEEVDSVFIKAEEGFDNFKRDIKVTPKSLVLGIFGGFTGGVLSGGLSGMLMKGTSMPNFLIGLVVIVCCYFFVWLFSRKSADNTATIVITLISALFAIILGFIISSN